MKYFKHLSNYNISMIIFLIHYIYNFTKRTFMFRQVLPIFFSLFLLSSGIAFAEENNETTTEEPAPQMQEEVTEEPEVQEKEPLSEAEADEIRESEASH